MAFVDPHRLGPAFRFLHRHQRRDESGKLTGFQRLDELRQQLRRVDETVRDSATLAAANERLTLSGSTFMNAALDLLGEIAGAAGVQQDAVRAALRTSLDVRITADADGKQRLSLNVPPRETLAAVFRGLAGLLGNSTAS